MVVRIVNIMVCIVALCGGIGCEKQSPQAPQSAWQPYVPSYSGVSVERVAEPANPADKVRDKLLGQWVQVGNARSKSEFSFRSREVFLTDLSTKKWAEAVYSVNVQHHAGKSNKPERTCDLTITAKVGTIERSFTYEVLRVDYLLVLFDKQSKKESVFIDPNYSMEKPVSKASEPADRAKGEFIGEWIQVGHDTSKKEYTFSDDYRAKLTDLLTHKTTEADYSINVQYNTSQSNKPSYSCDIAITTESASYFGYQVLRADYLLVLHDKYSHKDLAFIKKQDKNW